MEAMTKETHQHPPGSPIDVPDWARERLADAVDDNGVGTALTSSALQRKCPLTPRPKAPPLLLSHVTGRSHAQ